MEKAPRVINASKSRIYKELVVQARSMRQNPTNAEKILWNQLRRNNLGYKFRRQHIINKFIVDFYCLENGLIIEVDGKIHQKQKVRDIERTRILEAMGCKVVRFTNDEIMSNTIAVMEKIEKKLQSSALPL